MDCRPSAMFPLVALALLLATLMTGAEGTCDEAFRQLSVNHSRCMPDPEGWKVTVLPLTSEDKQMIVDLHNNYRNNISLQAADMMKMYWDYNLGRNAKARARSCTGDHEAKMVDRMVPGWSMLSIGQNIGINHKTWHKALDNFWKEKDDYNYFYGYGGDDPNSAKYPPGAGHFFQMAFAKTTRVGCAIVRCEKGDRNEVYRYCDYAPAMNAVQKPYEKGEACEKCPQSCDSNKGDLATFPNLCDCGNKICFNGGILDSTNCKCECPRRFTGNRCEKINCYENDLENCGWKDAANCGKEGFFMHDKKMCPHLCGLCDHVCTGQRCENGGTMNYRTCECTCREGYSGKSCETKELPECPETDISDCQQFYNESQCVEWSDTVTVPTPVRCPVLCQKCQVRNKECASFPCKNGGILNTYTCECQCRDHYSGTFCEICPAGNDQSCDGIFNFFYPSQPNFMHFFCPYMSAIESKKEAAKGNPQLVFPQCPP